MYAQLAARKWVASQAVSLTASVACGARSAWSRVRSHGPSGAQHEHSADRELAARRAARVALERPLHIVVVGRDAHVLHLRAHMARAPRPPDRASWLIGARRRWIGGHGGWIGGHGDVACPVRWRRRPLGAARSGCPEKRRQAGGRSGHGVGLQRRGVSAHRGGSGEQHPLRSQGAVRSTQRPHTVDGCGGGDKHSKRNGSP